MKKLLYAAGAILFGTLLLVSCEKDDPITQTEITTENGVFITNEGTFGASNASISYLNLDSNILYNNAFQQVNGRTLGDVLQSACIYYSTLFLVLNGSGKIEVCHAGKFYEQEIIEEFQSPRYTTVYNDKLYVTQWDSTGSVKVFNLGNYQEEARIEVGYGPEGILEVNGEIWVANSGAYGIDSTISVIDPTNNTVLKTIVVGHNPKEMVSDKDGNIWVICYGYIEYDFVTYDIVRETPSKLIAISPSYEVIQNITISANTHPSHIDINSSMDSVYFGGGYGFNGLFKVSTMNPDISETPFIDGVFYGFNVNPENGNVFAFEAPDFVNPGNLKVYDANGTPKIQGTVGIGPASAVFVKTKH